MIDYYEELKNRPDLLHLISLVRDNNLSADQIKEISEYCNALADGVSFKTLLLKLIMPLPDDDECIRLIYRFTNRYLQG